MCTGMQFFKYNNLFFICPCTFHCDCLRCLHSFHSYWVWSATTVDSYIKYNLALWQKGINGHKSDNKCYDFDVYSLFSEMSSQISLIFGTMTRYHEYLLHVKYNLARWQIVYLYKRHVMWAPPPPPRPPTKNYFGGGVGGWDWIGHC